MTETERPIVFVPKGSGELIYTLNSSEVNALLSSLPSGYKEVYPNSGIYVVSNIEEVQETHDSLFVK